MLFSTTRPKCCPSGAKAHCSCFLCVRAEARTLQKDEFFRSLYSPSPSGAIGMFYFLKLRTRMAATALSRETAVTSRIARFA